MGNFSPRSIKLNRPSPIIIGNQIHAFYCLRYDYDKGYVAMVMFKPTLDVPSVKGG